MRNSLRLGMAILLAGALSTFSGCGKDELQQAKPTTDAQQQAASVKGDFHGLSGKEAQQAWDAFVANVRRGIIKDPQGQYVSDDTWVQDEGKGPRPHRPKLESEARGLKSNNASGGEVTTNLFPQPDPCDDPNYPCGGGAPPSDPTFVSSEGVASFSGPGNYAGDIMDLKIAKHTNSWDVRALDGYIILPINLNYGAGGQTIYLTFTRNPNKVQLGDEADRSDRVISGAVRWIQSFAAVNGSITKWTIPDGIPVWAPGAFYNEWKHPDLNDGAGGYYIYPFMGKDPASGSPIEVGVLRGSSSNIQPPAGWTKDDQDLNEHAGGDYIYFCYKNR